MKRVYILLFLSLLLFGCRKKSVVDDPIDPPKNIAVACFSIATASPVYEDDTLSFTNCSSYATNYSWDFGDGTTSTDSLPQHAYSAAGTYLIKLIASNNNSTDTTSQSMTIQPLTDFRDGFVGIYSCMQLYSHPLYPSGWTVDTLSYNAQIEIQKLADSSIKVLLGSTLLFEGFYDGPNKFTCTICSGPEDYARFFAADSLYVYDRSGVTVSYIYYGKKN
jgi:PKD repeat protein